jgi:hypothetical protein
VRFFCIEDDLPPETPRLLRAACARRHLDYVAVDVAAVDLTRLSPPVAGDVVFRPSTSERAILVEQHLYRPDVGSVFTAPEGPSFACPDPVLLYERSGLPIAKTVPGMSADRQHLRAVVDALGGLPVVVKFPGFSGGRGVLRVESLAGLFSLMDLAQARGDVPDLCAFVANAVHWRLVVCGDRVVSAYKNVNDADDFRSSSDDDPANYRVEPTPEMTEIAVLATQLNGVSFAGVDLLQDPHGRLFLLEANSPCYFATAELAVGTDVSGAIVDHLVAVARRRAQERT